MSLIMPSVGPQLLLSSNSKILTVSVNGTKCQFLLDGQNSDLNLKLYSTCRQESRSIFGFQNRASDVKILKFNVNGDNSAYLEKRDFQRKLVCQF